MMLVGKDILTRFANKHTDAKGWVENWSSDIEGNAYKTPHELKGRYPKVSILGGNYYIFNVNGNDYRLETIIVFAQKFVRAVWAGTHAEYDERNKKR